MTTFDPTKFPYILRTEWQHISPNKQRRSEGLRAQFPIRTIPSRQQRRDSERAHNRPLLREPSARSKSTSTPTTGAVTRVPNLRDPGETHHSLRSRNLQHLTGRFGRRKNAANHHPPRRHQHRITFELRQKQNLPQTCRKRGRNAAAMP